MSVELFSAILSVDVLPHLGEKIALGGGFKKWLLTGTYEPVSSVQNSAKLDRVSSEIVSQIMALDYERFALSSLESYSVATAENREFGSAGWPLLKFYYSSFFAAHALLRSRGAGVVNIERAQADRVTQIGKLYLGSNFAFAPGAYFMECGNAIGGGSDEVSISLTPSPSKKGVHEAFWILFSKYFDQQASNALAKKLPDASDFVGYSTELKSAILGNGGTTAWLSAVRNRINYQHDFESWLPFRKGSEAKIVSEIAMIKPPIPARLDISREKSPLKAFLNTSCYISNINFHLGERVSTRSKKGGTFGQKWVRLKRIIDDSFPKQA